VELLILLGLILLNGLFAMSEMAVVSSRKVRLQQRAEEGRSGPKAALALANEPAIFLSTIQVGITVIGITSGAFGEATFSKQLSSWVSQWPALAPHAEGIADAIVITGITVASVIIGELVPKRLALLNPESIASVIAIPMNILSRAAYPLVRLLSLTTEGILTIMRVRRSTAPQVTEEDIKGLMEQGAEAGIFGIHEEALVRRVFRLDKLSVTAIMTPRTAIVYLDTSAPLQANLRRIAETGHSRYPVSRNRLAHVDGVVFAKGMFADALSGKSIQLDAHMLEPLYVRSTATVMELVELLRRHKQTMAVVLGEGGTVQGIVTLHDIMEALAGEIAAIEDGVHADITKRADGSWLIGGTAAIEPVKEALQINEDLPGEHEAAFHSVGGFVMHQLNRVPSAGDKFDCMGWHFEVVDMDERRVDKVLASPIGARRRRAQRSPRRSGRLQ
jgi:putative hemolysin